MIREACDTHHEADQVSFADLVQAKFEAQRVDGAAADLDATRQAFIKHFGPIICSRFGKNTVCGVALTDLNAAARLDPASRSQSASAGDRRSWLRTPHRERRWLRR